MMKTCNRKAVGFLIYHRMFCMYPTAATQIELLLRRTLVLLNESQQIRKTFYSMQIPLALRVLLTSRLNVQVSDTTGDAQRTGSL